MAKKKASSSRSLGAAPKKEKAAPVTFGARLRAAREAADMSQQELGDATGFDKRSVARYEQGGALPSIEAAARLAGPLGASLDALAGLSVTSSDPELARLFSRINDLNADVRSATLLVLQALVTTHTRQ